ncbi:hypothetical protein GOBAR_AA36019 [Gossypium barbadense]|uniref:Protein MIZU-KUSSEI 1 n=1 Tax=Gossypium barbadense TaxID=3634 RepID=A0A2P5W0W0_GOSBA|nr:hypothetical protein GOBAR_AA36019 [Gossypium barbadense]
MTKIDALRRLLPCLSPTTATSKATSTPIKKRLSTSLRNDVVDHLHPVLTNTKTKTPKIPPQQPISNRPFRPSHALPEMSSGTVRIALECDHSELSSCPLHSVPIWTMYCNGRKIGFATKRKATRHNRLMLKTMQSIIVGAGMIPTGVGSSGSEEIMYMRANYEHVIGNSDYESFHLVNPDECAGQELSVYLMRSR